jgi:hypothetical protein
MCGREFRALSLFAKSLAFRELAMAQHKFKGNHRRLRASAESPSSTARIVDRAVRIKVIFV